MILAKGSEIRVETVDKGSYIGRFLVDGKQKEEDFVLIDADTYNWAKLSIRPYGVFRCNTSLIDTVLKAIKLLKKV